MNLPPRVTTERLTLDLISLEEAVRMRSGARDPLWHPDYPRQDDRDAVSMVREGDTWGARHVARRLDGIVFGSIGFFGPPTPSVGAPGDGALEAEIGYGLVADARGRGVATEAVGALLALTDGLGVRVRACVLPENRASVRVLAKCGFTELRGANEDGELVMARPLPRVVAGA